MKKIGILLLILSLVLPVCFTSLAEDADPEEWEESVEILEEEEEPEEEPGEGLTEIEAEEIRVGREQTVQIPAGETVYLRFAAPETGGFCFASASNDEETDPAAFLFSESSDLLATGDDADGGLNFRVFYLLEKGKVYYLACENTSSEACSYPVTVSPASGLLYAEAVNLPEKWNHYMTLTVKASATAGTPLAYQWYQGVQEAEGGEGIIDDLDYRPLEGENQDFLVVTRPAEGMVYCCRISDDRGQVRTVFYLLGEGEEIDVITGEDFENPADEEMDETEEDPEEV